MSEFNLVLYQPVIPQNTGSIARLCACTGARLHLIHPLGFQTDEKSVKRAGLDYWSHVKVSEYKDWQDFTKRCSPQHLYLFSKFAATSLYDAKVSSPAYLVLGSETKGIPESLRNDHKDSLFKIPMRTHLVRSLNLAQAAAVVLYEGMRQAGKF